ncbi:MFS transporter [Paenibacillus sp. BIHB 4019]|uniref:MFS transporter n=1 Tax=Paenibacillus sp. BIHB 4019 TaxID=1870819 RepID=A0A1B2DEW0_9BACL|nr:MFS transporter [Paenibacillus sp. BIHB 4019]ANY66225.1 MFS transporter [Paenibacillus sp. BIHB 4019]
MQKYQRWIMLAIVSIALLLISLDMTILYTALPTLTSDLSASASEKLWIINAYPLVMSGLLLGIGALGDRLGHKRIFAAGLVVFGAASLIAALSPTPAILIIGRIFLAVGAAMMMPATLSIIRIHFEDERERYFAFGVWGSVFSGGAGLGPLLGGALLEHFYWGSVFLLNIPVVLLAFLFSLKFVPADKGHSSRSWDWMGSIQIMLGLIGVIFAVKEATRRGGYMEMAIISLLIGAISIFFFIKRQKTINDPLIDLGLFKNWRFTGGVVTAMLASFILVGSQLLFTQRYQLVLGYSPLKSSLFMIAIPIASFIAGIVMGMYTHRFNLLKAQLSAIIVAGLGLGGYLIFYNDSPIMQVLTMVILGCGLGVGGTTASNAIMNSVPIEKSGMAASSEEVSYELGSALGVAILGSFLSFFYTRNFVLTADIVAPPMVRDSLDEALLAAENLSAQAAATLIDTAKIAFNQSFVVVNLVALGILIVGGLVITFAIQADKRRPSPKH